MDQKLGEFSEFREFDKSLKHLVASWSLMQEMIFLKCNIFVTGFAEFSDNI